MALSYTTHSVAAGTTSLTFPVAFNYLIKSHVKLYYGLSLLENTYTSLLVDGTDYTWTSNTQVQLSSAPASNQTLTIIRNTPSSTQIVQWQDGSNLVAADINTADLQGLYVVQEFQDKVALGIPTALQAKATADAAANAQATAIIQDGSRAMAANLNLDSNRIINVTDPTGAQDAATKSYVDTNFQPLDAELTELATMPATTASSLADLSAAEVQILDGATVTTAELNTLDGITAVTSDLNVLQGITASTAELNLLDGVTATTAELNLLDGVTATTAELNILDGVTATATELNVLDGITASTAELNTLDGITASAAELNQLDGKTISGTLTPANTNDVPTSSAVNSYVTNLLDALGGFVAIADRNSFPANNPDPSDDAGTVVSIADASGLVIGGTGSATNARTSGNGADNVTITGFPASLQSTTLAAGLGLQVQTTSTANTYTYHKLIAKEADIVQLSDDLNDFNNRYRIAPSNPTSDNDEGDLVFNTTDNALRVFDGSNWVAAAAANASQVGFTAGGTLASTNVQDAIAELRDETAHRTSGTGSIALPSGTTGERDGSPSAGFLRFNTTDGKPEVYNGSAWGSVGGGATGGGSDTVFHVNGNTVNSSYSIPSNSNAVSAGPITVASGATITIPSGSAWVIV